MRSKSLVSRWWREQKFDWAMRWFYLQTVSKSKCIEGGAGGSFNTSFFPCHIMEFTCHTIDIAVGASVYTVLQLFLVASLHGRMQCKSLPTTMQWLFVSATIYFVYLVHQIPIFLKFGTLVCSRTHWVDYRMPHTQFGNSKQSSCPGTLQNYRLCAATTPLRYVSKFFR